MTHSFFLFSGYSLFRLKQVFRAARGRGLNPITLTIKEVFFILSILLGTRRNGFKEKNMVIIVTGASSGIGKTCAEYFSNQGHQVYGFSRRVVSGVTFQSQSVDVTDLASVQQAVQEIIEKEKGIDVVLNNAGKGMLGAVEDARAEEVLDLFKLNLMACLNLQKAVMPQMRLQKSGYIFNVSSLGSVMGLPFRGLYSASKSALDKTTEAFRFEIRGTGVQACTLNLGDVVTNIADNRIGSQVSEAYKEKYETVVNKINEHVDEGISPSEVAEFVGELLKQKKPLKLHYYVAPFSQTKGVWLKRLLPQKWFEKMLANYVGI